MKNLFTSLSRTFCLFVFAVLFSINCFADSKFYGMWNCEGGNNTEVCVTLYYVNVSSTQHDVIGGEVPCFGYINYSEDMDSPLCFYLVKECEENSDGVRLSLFAKTDDIPSGCIVTLKYEDDVMVITNEDGGEGSIGKLLDGLTLTHSQTLSVMAKSEDTWSDANLDADESGEEANNAEVTDDTLNQASSTVGAAEKEPYWGSERMKSDFEGLAILILYLAIIAHMIYEWFIRKCPYKKTGYTVDEMMQARAESGKPSEMSQQEADELGGILDNLFVGWLADDEGGAYPAKHSQIAKAEKDIARMAELQPVNQDVIDAMNQLIELLEACKKRVFNGSYKLITITVIVAALLVWISGTWRFIPFFVFSLAIYWGASMTPTWMLIKNELKGKSGRHTSTGFLLGLLAFIGSAKTVTTITKYDDGSETKDVDYSQHYFVLAIGLFLLFFLAIFIAVWAIFNYVRNYILYK